LSAWAWLLYVVLAAGVSAAAFFVYGRRESAGRGRRLLASLRAATLALVLLLLFDPRLPGVAVGRGPARMVLLDASLSMNAPGAGGETTWQRAIRLAQQGGAGRVILFGDVARSVRTDSLAALSPTEAHSRLAPALRAAAEAGAARVRVLTDGRLEDGDEARGAAAEAGLSVDMVDLGAARLPDRSLAEVDAPAWAEAGKGVDIRVGVAWSGGDSAQARQPVRVHAAGGGATAEATVQPPAAGLLGTAVLHLQPTAPPSGGLVRFDLSLIPRDSVPADDSRAVYVYVAERPAGIVVVSFQPDWEPRFLQPILADALGLPAQGFLRLGEDRYVGTGGALTAGKPATEAEARAAAEQADLLVLHGVGAASPEWAQKLLRQARRVIVFPAGTMPEGDVPVSLPPPTPADWYIATEPPASPIAAYLAGLVTDSMPPLSELRVVQPPAGAWSILDAQRDRSGPRVPALVAGESGGRRWVVATGTGYWRWAFRGGAAREAYRSLWSALAGWLAHDVSGIAPLPVRPVDWAVERSERVGWEAPGLAADSLVVSLTDSAGAAVMDTSMSVAAGDTAWTRPPAPGNYRYAAAAFSGGKPVGRATGPLTVELYSPDYARPVFDWRRAGGTRQETAGAAGERPLHESVWPYALILALLSLEWALRRRWGLT
jgi:hypothetical protein